MLGIKLFLLYFVVYASGQDLSYYGSSNVRKQPQRPLYRPSYSPNVRPVNPVYNPQPVKRPPPPDQVTSVPQPYYRPEPQVVAPSMRRPSQLMLRSKPPMYTPKSESEIPPQTIYSPIPSQRAIPIQPDSQPIDIPLKPWTLEPDEVTRDPTEAVMLTLPTEASAPVMEINPEAEEVPELSEPVLEITPPPLTPEPAYPPPESNQPMQPTNPNYQPKPLEPVASNTPLSWPTPMPETPRPLDPVVSNTPLFLPTPMPESYRPNDQPLAPPEPDRPEPAIMGPLSLPSVPPTAYPTPVETQPPPQPTTSFPVVVPTSIVPAPGPDIIPIIPISDFKCSRGNGYYTIINECDTYIECQSNRAYKQSCPDGLHFNPQALYPDYPCAYPSEVKCESSASIQIARPTNQCSHQYGYFPISGGDCSEYITCQEGIAMLMNCPFGLVFNEYLSSCDWPENVPHCNPNAFKDFTCPTPPEDDPDALTKFSYDSDCALYVACQHGFPKLLRCDLGMSFDENSQLCKDTDLVAACRRPISEVAALGSY